MGRINAIKRVGDRVRFCIGKSDGLLVTCFAHKEELVGGLDYGCQIDLHGVVYFVLCHAGARVPVDHESHVVGAARREEVVLEFCVNV